MKAFQLGPQTGIDGLSLVDRPAPRSGSGRRGVARPRRVPQPPRSADRRRDIWPAATRNADPLSEGVGEVIALGDGVASVKLGDRVVCPHFVTWLGGAFTPSAFGTDIGVTHDGWLAEQVSVPAAALVVVNDLTDRQAAPLASSALTAWHAVVEVGQVNAGDTVLALGTGGVSIFALQIAKASGARVAITSSSDAKLATARALGADITINYATTDWAAALNEATGGKGADIVVETGGQATLGQSIAAAAVGGRIVVIGALGGGGDDRARQLRDDHRQEPDATRHRRGEPRDAC